MNFPQSVVMIHIVRNQFLFTCQFPIKAWQCNPKSLQSTHWVPEIKCENIFTNFSELHNDIVRISFVNHLKILHTSLRDTAMKIEQIRLAVIIPNRRFVLEFQDSIQIPCFVLIQKTLTILRQFSFFPASIFIHTR